MRNTVSVVYAYAVCVPYTDLINGLRRAELVKLARELDDRDRQHKVEETTERGYHEQSSWGRARENAFGDEDDYTSEDLLDECAADPFALEEMVSEIIEDYKGIGIYTDYLNDNGEEGAILVYVEGSFVFLDINKLSDAVPATTERKMVLQRFLYDFGIAAEPKADSYRYVDRP